MFPIEKYFSQQELTEFADILNQAKPEHFKVIVTKTNKLLAAVWRKKVDAPLFHRGSRVEFTSEQRQQLFLIRYPTVGSFSRIKSNVDRLPDNNPAKAVMQDTIEKLTPLVLMVQGMSTKRVYDDASLRTGE